MFNSLKKKKKKKKRERLDYSAKTPSEKKRDEHWKRSLIYSGKTYQKVTAIPGLNYRFIQLKL